MVPLILSPSPPGAGFISFECSVQGRDSTPPGSCMKGGVAIKNFARSRNP